MRKDHLDETSPLPPLTTFRPGDVVYLRGGEAWVVTEDGDWSHDKEAKSFFEGRTKPLDR